MTNNNLTTEQALELITRVGRNLKFKIQSNPFSGGKPQILEFKAIKIKDKNYISSDIKGQESIDSVRYNFSKVWHTDYKGGFEVQELSSFDSKYNWQFKETGFTKNSKLEYKIYDRTELADRKNLTTEVYCIDKLSISLNEANIININKYHKYIIKVVQSLGHNYNPQKQELQIKELVVVTKIQEDTFIIAIWNVNYKRKVQTFKGICIPKEETKTPIKEEKYSITMDYLEINSPF